MTRFLAILAALTCAASAQTYRTVTAETNNAIRTNFSLVRSQISDLSGASFAISNVSGLQTALDAKIATNGSASGLTNFPALLLTTNSAASAFPSALLRTNGDGSGLTNLPNANLSNATGVLPIANGGTGATNASSARTALQLGSAATNAASAFQAASSALTNLAAGDASGLTNLPNANLSTATGVLGLANGGSAATNAEGARTNFGLVWSGLTNTDATGFRAALSLGSSATNDASAFQPANANLTNLAANNGGSLTNVSVDLTAVLPSYSNNAGKVLAVATGATNVEWTALSNTVTDASTLTNFPAIILQTNSADGSFPAFLLRTNGSAAGLTSFPTLNQNTTGTASNVTGTVAITNGGSGQTTAAAAIEAFLPAYSGNANRILALNSNANGLVWTTNAGGGGTVDLSTTNATGVLPITKGGTGATNARQVLTNLGIINPWVDNMSWGINVGSTNTVTVSGVIIGQDATNSNRGIAIGGGARGLEDSVAIGVGAKSTNGGGAIGKNAISTQGGAIGEDSYTSIGGAVGHSAQAGSGGAIGRLANTINGKGFAGGQSSEAINGFAGGLDAKATATNASQIGTGTNTNNNTIQFLSAGSVDTNEWSRIAALSTYPTTNISVVGTNNTNTLVFSNGILVQVQ